MRILLLTQAFNSLAQRLFVALGEQVGKDGSWAIRLYYKPFIRWIWLGAILMSIGGLLAGTDKRYRQMARRELEANNLAGSAA